MGDLFDDDLDLTSYIKDSRFDNVRNEFFPNNLQEYSKIILAGEKSPPTSLFSNDMLNILTTDISFLKDVDSSKYLFSKKQIINFIHDSSIEIEYNEDFILNFVSRDGNIKQLDSYSLNSKDSILKAFYLYNSLYEGIYSKELSFTPDEYRLLNDNYSQLKTLSENVTAIETFLQKNIDIISRNFK